MLNANNQNNEIELKPLKDDEGEMLICTKLDKPSSSDTCGPFSWFNKLGANIKKSFARKETGYQECSTDDCESQKINSPESSLGQVILETFAHGYLSEGMPY